MFELRSDERKYPIKVDTIEKACALIQTVKCIYNRDLFLTGEIPDEFDIEQFNDHIKNVSQWTVDILILGHDLASLEQKEDFSVLFAPIFADNTVLVDQYKTGNEKALNALMGKFLKSNKGYDPKEVKDELIKLLS